MINFKTWADQVNVWATRHARTHNGESPSPAALRDMADFKSGGDLDTLQLDILCDMIDARIAKWSK